MEFARKWEWSVALKTFFQGEEVASIVRQGRIGQWLNMDPSDSRGERFYREELSGNDFAKIMTSLRGNLARSRISLRSASLIN
jgi:hypothetical protein